MNILRSIAQGFASIGRGMADICGSVLDHPLSRSEMFGRYEDRTVINRDAVLGQMFRSSTTATISGGPPIENTKEAVAARLEEAARQWDENARRWRATPFPKTGEEAARDSENVAQQYRDLARDVREGRATFTVTSA